MAVNSAVCSWRMRTIELNFAVLQERYKQQHLSYTTFAHGHRVLRTTAARAPSGAGSQVGPVFAGFFFLIVDREQ